jgi:aspartokinase-like uncharacterized kinase
MAILGMEQFGWLLSDLIPGAVRCTDLEWIDPDRTSVLLPAGLPLDLPASWDVTSDSIAAWVARRTGAERLILVKAVAAVDDYFETAIQDARFETAFISPEEVPDSPLLPSSHG